MFHHYTIFKSLLNPTLVIGIHSESQVLWNWKCPESPRPHFVILVYSGFCKVMQCPWRGFLCPAAPHCRCYNKIHWERDTRCFVNTLFIDVETVSKESSRFPERSLCPLMCHPELTYLYPVSSVPLARRLVMQVQVNERKCCCISLHLQWVCCSLSHAGDLQEL